MELARVETHGLWLDDESRDTLVAANAFLALLLDKVEDPNTKFWIRRIISDIGDMLYAEEAKK